ncbi:MAG TPA: hypothetical protein VFU07_05390 [Candidatus Lumbricidophila sp.]|nr:hypothetical protein [Candidatus Lumbricidophila sp.]
MTSLVIHYQSPKHDPLKVPRPHMVECTADHTVSRGEIGEVGSLVGFTPTNTPSLEMVFAEDVIDGSFDRNELAGMYPVFVGPRYGMFTYDAQVKHVKFI